MWDGSGSKALGSTVAIVLVMRLEISATFWTDVGVGSERLRETVGVGAIVLVLPATLEADEFATAGAGNGKNPINGGCTPLIPYENIL